MIDTQGLAFAKPRPHLLEKREKAAALKARDNAERKKCHIRSGGRCEVQIVSFRPSHSDILVKRCNKAARHNHHLISGSGRRNVGASILAKHRLDCCATCHTEIENAVLVPVNYDHAELAAKVRYERRN